MQNIHTKGLLLSLIAIVLMSIESPLIKISSLDSHTISFFLGLSLFLSTNFIMLLQGRDYLIQSYKKEYKGVLISGLAIGLGNYFFILAVMYAGVANTVLLLATTPIFSSLVTHLVFKKSTSKYLFVATFFIFIGLYIILHDDMEKISFLGLAFAFICMACMIVSLSALKYFPKASRIAYVSMGGFWLFLLSLFFLPFHIENGRILYIFLLGLMTMPLSRYLLGIGARYVFPQELSLLMILESVLAPLFAWWWIGEVLPANTLIGGAIILFTLIIYFLMPKK